MKGHVRYWRWFEHGTRIDANLNNCLCKDKDSKKWSWISELGMTEKRVEEVLHWLEPKKVRTICEPHVRLLSKAIGVR